MLLIANFSQPSVTLERGDAIGASRRLTGEAAARAEDGADEATVDQPPDVAHVQRQEEELQRLHEVDMPPEEYYDALAAWRNSRFPNACPHVREHAEALEPFLGVCIASGFSLGAGKSLSLIHI